MTSKELKKLLRAQFPSLKKRWPWSDDPIIARDRAYPEYEHDIQIYQDIDAAVWNYVLRLGIVYGSEFPDCDDFSDIKVGKFKELWWIAIQEGLIPRNSPPRYTDFLGLKPNGEMHDFNGYTYKGKIYISDYGDTVGPEGYEPYRARI